MAEVLKSNGSTVPYDESKVRASVKKAILDAGLSIGECRDVIESAVSSANKVAQNAGTVASAAIRDAVLSSLEKTRSEAAAAWRAFDARYKKKSA